MVKEEKGGKKVFFNYFRKRHLEGTRTLSADVFVLQQGASHRAVGKAGYSGSWAPPTATAQAQHSFLELTGPEPASRVPLAVRYSPAPPGLSQSERLDGRGFQQRGGEWVWIGSLEDGDVAEGGRFVSELRLWHTVQDWC